MFNYTNNTIINSNIEPVSGLNTYSVSGDILKILKFGEFNKNNVVDSTVYSRSGYEPTYSTATFAVPAAPTGAGAETIYRLKLTLRQYGNATSVYANAASVYMQKPIYIEFKASTGDTQDQIADAILAAVKFYQSNLFPYIKATKAGTAPNITVTITSADEYILFDVAEVEQLVSATVSVYPDDQNQYVKVSNGTIVKGKYGFGTYSYLMRSLRLPTLEALRFGSPTLSEMPVVGSLYSQYTIRYRVNRGVLGSDAVGDEVNSITTHVI